jgi:transposase
MAKERIPVRKIKETLRLHHQCGLSRRAVARSLRIAPSTVHDYLDRAALAGLSWPLPDGLGDAELEQRLFEKEARIAGAALAVPDWRGVHTELRRKGVTLQLVWEEYRARHAKGYSYSRFCELYRAWAKQLHPTMRLDHKAGERAFVDYAGPEMEYLDPETGELLAAPVFVAALGASSYTYTEAQSSAEMANWLAGHVNAFNDWDGTPAIVVVDNLRTGVTSPCRYEPDVNRSYYDLAVHYGVAVLPARVATPRDKPKVETAVQVVERWVMAPLRHERFVGLAAVNAAMRLRLDLLNNRVMKHLGKSRRQLFEELDKPALRPLPDHPFELGLWKTAKVSIDYHVEFDGHYYSVPYRMIHQTVEIRATLKVVEVYLDGGRIASHLRSRIRGGHTTLPEHMPEQHRQYMEWTPERIIRWAQDIGPNTAQLVAAVIAAKDHPEQGYRSCLGILRLAKGSSDARLEAAAGRSLAHGLYSYKGVKRILDDHLDDTVVESEPSIPPAPPHENVRGPAYYADEEHADAAATHP